MPNPHLRTKKRLTADYWYPISKIMGIRWYMNKLENTLLSIVAEHPDVHDPYREKSFRNNSEDIYTRVWNALARCEAEIVKIKKIHKPRRPANYRPDGKGGCWCDDDCGSGFYCNTATWMCEPGNQPPDPGQDLS